MVNIALPYVLLSTLLIILSSKFEKKEYLYAINFLYSILALFFISQQFLYWAKLKHLGVTYEIFAFLNRVLHFGVYIHFGLLIFSLVSASFFLFRKFRTKHKFNLFVIFSACLGIIDSYLYPIEVIPGWHTMSSPVFDENFVIFSFIFLSIGSIFFVKLKILPEFRKYQHSDILDEIDS